MSKSDKSFALFVQWYENLKHHKSSGGPARGTIVAALVVLENLQECFSLDLDDHRAKGKAQLKGLGIAPVSRILHKFGEDRPFLKEGGRTNRGGPGDIESLLLCLNQSGISKLSPEQRNKSLVSMQKFLIERIQDYHNKQRLNLAFDSGSSLWEAISGLMRSARQSGKDGPVAQYLVGAKLQLRFPHIAIENFSYSTADDPSGRQGDFLIEDTVFHITVSPMPGVFKKCLDNIKQSLSVYLIVPDSKISGARQNADNYQLFEKITITSIESFISQNIDELSMFSRKNLLKEFHALIELYNKRVDEIETDKSLLIEIPKYLLKYN